MARILLCNCHPPHDGPVVKALQAGGHEITICSDSDLLAEEIVARRPDVLVYVLDPDPAGDLPVLRFARRAATGVPLVILAREGSLSTQRQILDLRPTYYAVLPVDQIELLEAVRAALGSSGSATRPETGKARRP